MSDDDPFLHDPTAFEKLIIAIGDREALPEALALIKQFREFLLYCGAMDGATFDTARAQLTADAAAFLARVKGD